MAYCRFVVTLLFVGLFSVCNSTSRYSSSCGGCSYETGDVDIYRECIRNPSGECCGNFTQRLGFCFKSDCGGCDTTLNRQRACMYQSPQPPMTICRYIQGRRICRERLQPRRRICCRGFTVVNSECVRNIAIATPSTTPQTSNTTTQITTTSYATTPTASIESTTTTSEANCGGCNTTLNRQRACMSQSPHPPMTICHYIQGRRICRERPHPRRRTCCHGFAVVNLECVRNIPIPTPSTTHQPSNTTIQTNTTSYATTPSGSIESTTATTEATPLECGKPAPSFVPMVVGGSSASQGQFPWQVWLRRLGVGHFCSGTLISAKTILTAAHCIVEGSNRYRIHVGSNSLQTENGEGIHRLDHYLIHPNFRRRPARFDLAMLVLRSAVTLSPRVQPACLPPHPNISSYINASVTVSGWGLNETDGVQANILKYGEMKVAPPILCKERYGWRRAAYRRIHRFIVCVSDGHGDTDISLCSGDSGSGLLHRDPEKGTYTIIGVMSHGHPDGCASGNPVVYTSVSNTMRWILQHIVL